MYVLTYVCMFLFAIEISALGPKSAWHKKYTKQVFTAINEDASNVIEAYL